MTLFDLDGRVAVVTGGNGGIGLGMARGLAAAGARLVLSGRDAAKGAAAVATLERQGAEAIFVTADVTHRTDCAALMQAAMTRFGRLDILVNNAGISIRQRPEDFDDTQWHAVLDTNLTSAFLCAQEAYPLLKQGGGGKIVNIASVMSLVAAPFSVPYAASKGGLLQLTKGLAAAWAADNIQVNAILPGWIDTDMTVTARNQVSSLDATVVARTPAGRWGRPDDLAGAAVFLSSAASDFITGVGLPVDGGLLAKA